MSIKEKNPSAITSVQPKTACAPAFQILPVFHLSVSLGLFPPCRALLLPLCSDESLFISISLFSDQNSSSLCRLCCAHTAGCRCCSHTAFTQFHLISGTHLHIHTIVQTCYRLSPTSPSGTNTALHTPNPFSKTKHLTSCSSTTVCVYWTQKTQAA